MSDLQLKRSDDLRTSYANFGVLRYEHFECKTLELPFKGNQRNISCIPKARYQYVVLPRSKKIPYEHIWILNVPGRSGVKIHIINFVRDLEGCIGVGKTFADIDRDGEIDIRDSGETLRKLISLIPTSGEITIK